MCYVNYLISVFNINESITESVLSNNCPNMLKGIRGTRCIDKTLRFIASTLRKK